MLPVFPEDSPRSAGRSDPGSFQIIPSALGTRTYEILHVSFKSRVSVSHRDSSGTPQASPIALQSQMFWELIFLAQDPQVGKPKVEFRSLSPW